MGVIARFFRLAKIAVAVTMGLVLLAIVIPLASKLWTSYRASQTAPSAAVPRRASLETRSLQELMSLKEGPEKLDLISKLLKDGADPDAIVIHNDQTRYSALHMAAISGQNELANLLVRSGATVDVKGMAPLDGATIEGVTPLMLAAAHGNAPIARILLAAGARIDMTASNNMNAVGFLLYCKDRAKALEVSRLLVKK